MAVSSSHVAVHETQHSMVEAVAACWWQARCTHSHQLSDLPLHLVQQIASHTASVPVWRRTFSHQRSIALGDSTFPYGIAFLSNGDMVVSEDLYDGPHCVQRLSPRGETVTTIAHKGSEPGQVFEPKGLCVVDDLHILVADHGNKRVQRLCVDGSGAVQQIGVGVLQAPMDVTTHNGDVYVADYSGDCITVFSPEGAVLRSFGTHGTGEGQFGNPAAVAVTSHGDVVVAERSNGRVQVLQADGTHVRFVPAKRLQRPFGVAVDGNDTVVIADTFGHRLIAVSVSDGRVLATYGKKGANGGEFYCPRNVALLADGSVAVTDYRNNRVQIV